MVVIDNKFIRLRAGVKIFKGEGLCRLVKSGHLLSEMSVTVRRHSQVKSVVKYQVSHSNSNRKSRSNKNSILFSHFCRHYGFETSHLIFVSRYSKGCL